jgi:hypothetical protein
MSTIYSTISYRIKKEAKKKKLKQHKRSTHKKIVEEKNFFKLTDSVGNG